ncbi:MAG: serine hydroxymethyltransferase, partial [Oscillospiraceae bacterium]
VNITTNKNTIPNDPEKPFVTSGVRLGTPAATTRGFREDEMRQIASFIAGCVFNYEDKKEEIAAGVRELTARFPLYAD